jgi:hypothetical protein
MICCMGRESTFNCCIFTNLLKLSEQKKNTTFEIKENNSIYLKVFSLAYQ